MDEKFKKEAEEFKNNFREFKDKKIVIYGIGRKTMTLLEQIPEFNVIGLLDRDDELIGTYKFGFKILSRQEVEKEADIVIINTMKVYWNTIYNRINDWNITIYTNDGKKIESDDACIDNNNEYWNKNYIELEEKLHNYDVVSFDIFDTLIMRKVCFSNEVFILTEKCLKKDFGEGFSYVDIRNKAENSLDNPTITEIFSEIQKQTDWDKEKIHKIMFREIEIDRALLEPRRDIVKLCNEVISTKEVYFVSDMYYTSEILFDFLQACGIHIIDKNKIIVSCELKQSKKDGGLWTYFRNKIVEKKILHIGDNQVSDIENPNKQNIDTYFVMSAFEMLQKSSLKRLSYSIASLDESVHIGVLINKMFNSPFSLFETRGEAKYKTEENAGYILLGGIVYAYLMWLIKNTKENKIEQVLFVGRDGYLMIKAYEYLKTILNEEPFEAVYLESSRRILQLATLETKEDIYELLENTPYVGTVSDFLQSKFSVDIKDDLTTTIMMQDLEKTEKKMIFKKYIDQILLKAKDTRDHYLKYLSVLNIKEKFAVADTGCAGTIQYCLGKIMNKSTIGYYFYALMNERNKFYRNNMYACFQNKEDSNAEKVNLLTNCQFLDSFFTSPKGMLLDINEREMMIYDEVGENQKHFNLRLKMLNGIEEYIQEIYLLRRKLFLPEAIKECVFYDNLFGVMIENSTLVTKDMIEGFYIDDVSQKKGEIPLWK